MRSHDETLALQEAFALAEEEYKGDPPAKFIARSMVRAVVWDKTSGRCWYCGEQTNPFRGFVIDHLIARSLGGDESYGNLVPCCQRCNGVKLCAPVSEFRRRLARHYAQAPKFTDEQLAYLEKIGVDVSGIMPFDEFKFYFEEQGL